jgi:hypothetical protein
MEQGRHWAAQLFDAARPTSFQVFTTGKTINGRRYMS